MYVAVRQRQYKNKEYNSAQIVEGYRNEEGKPRQRTLLDISKLGMDKILAVKAALQGKQIVDWDSLEGFNALDFGIPYVVEEVLKSLEIPEILSEIDDHGAFFFPVILGMICNRIDEPCAKYGFYAGSRIRHSSIIPALSPRKLIITRTVMPHWISLKKISKKSRQLCIKGGRSLSGSSSTI